MAFLTVCYYSKGRQNVHFKHQACRVYDCLSGIFTERTAKHCTVLTNAPSFIYFYLSLFSLSKEARFYRLSLKCSEPSALAKKLICAKFTTSSPCYTNCSQIRPPKRAWFSKFDSSKRINFR